MSRRARLRLLTNENGMLLKSLNHGRKALGGVLELAEGGDDKVGKVAGRATTPHPDLYGHIVAQNAFSESIARKGLTGAGGIQLLSNHNWEQPSGVITKLEYRNRGLWMEADLNLNISYARDQYEASKSKGGLSFSVGFRPSYEPGDIEFIEAPDGNEYIVIHKGELREVSVVANPANQEAVMEWVKSDKDPPIPLSPPVRGLESVLDELLKSDLSEEAVAAAIHSAGWTKTRGTADSLAKLFAELSKSRTTEPEPTALGSETLEKAVKAMKTLQLSLKGGQEE